MAFHARVFNGTGLQTMRYADGTGSPSDWKDSNLIMHGQLTIGDGTLMASDFPPGMEGDRQKAVSVMQTAPAARAMFDQLLDGGAVVQPFAATFFSPGFAMVKDRFGTHWIISAMPQAAS